jgi:CBS domain-containing protein
MTISSLSGAPVIRVSPTASIIEVAGVLAQDDIGAVVVGDGGSVTGIVSERDVTRAVADGHDLQATTAADIAHTELIWCDATATVAEVAEEMMEKWVRHILVRESASVVGIVSARDLLGAYAAADASFD